MTPPETTPRQTRLLQYAIVAGFGLRLALMFFSLGTNDIGTWLGFAESVRDVGLAQTYLDLEHFNHPPLMGLMSVLVLRISEATALPFSAVFKVPSLLAEGVTAFLLYRIWKERSGPSAGLRAAAAYSMALCSIVISGYHGNTDAIYFCLALLAAYLMESKSSPFWAGVAMAGALNVKVIPVVAVLPLWSRCTQLREAVRYALGGLVGAIPVLVALAAFAPDARRAFLEHLLLYRSNLEFWGVELVVRCSRVLAELVSPALGEMVRGLGDLYIAYGGELVVIATALLALRHAVRTQLPRLDAYQLILLGFAVFLLFGPGFGVQYVGCVVAPIIAGSIRRGVVVATVTGIYITAVYAWFVVDWSPIYSVHSDIPWGLSPLGLVAWGTVLWACQDLLSGVMGRDRTTESEAPAYR